MSSLFQFLSKNSKYKSSIFYGEMDFNDVEVDFQLVSNEIALIYNLSSENRFMIKFITGVDIFHVEFNDLRFKLHED